MDSLLRKIVNKQKIPLEHFESFEYRQKIVITKRLITKKLTAIRKSTDLRLIVEFSRIVEVRECCINPRMDT